jgi:hypothetical protein
MKETLDAAAAMVAEVLKELDRSEKVCECCGVKARNNWDDHQAGQVLEGVIAKIEKCADKIVRDARNKSEILEAGQRIIWGGKVYSIDHMSTPMAWSVSDHRGSQIILSVADVACGRKAYLHEWVEKRGCK